jgi:hypothetical protein
VIAASEVRRVHDWFLRRGLPLLLTRRVRVRSRALIARSAPGRADCGAVGDGNLRHRDAGDGERMVGCRSRRGSDVSGDLAGGDLVDQAATPLAELVGSGPAPARTPLSRGEQVNVVAVMVVSQAIQVVFFAAGLFAFFLALGIVAVPDDVTVLWSTEQSCPVGQPPCAGTWFGIHVPVPQTVVHMSLFVAVLSGLYFTVSTSVDPLYRRRYFEPLIADVVVSLAGRDAYLELEKQRRSRGTAPGSIRCRWPDSRLTTSR